MEYTFFYFFTLIFNIVNVQIYKKPWVVWYRDLACYDLAASRHPGATPFSGRGRGIKGIKGGKGGGRESGGGVERSPLRSPNPTQPNRLIYYVEWLDFLFELVGHRRGTCIHLLRHLRTTMLNSHAPSTVTRILPKKITDVQCFWVRLVNCYCTYATFLNKMCTN